MPTLRDEIKQTKPFARPADEALLSIMRTAAVLEHAGNEALKPHGLTHTQYNVLRILRGAGKRGLCGRDIAERMVSHVPDVSRLLDRMEDAGVIVRMRDPGTNVILGSFTCYNRYCYTTQFQVFAC